MWKRPSATPWIKPGLLPNVLHYGLGVEWIPWKRFGGIMLSTDKGRGRDWRIAVLDDVPRAAFESPEPLGF